LLSGLAAFLGKFRIGLPQTAVDSDTVY